MNLAEALRTELSSLRERQLEPVGVAILDTGIDSSHPDLRDRVIQAFEVERAGRRFRIAQRSISANNDRLGHGTGVSSTIAAIAPNAHLIDIQVEAPAVHYRELRSPADGESSAIIRERVIHARAVQTKRFGDDGVTWDMPKGTDDGIAALKASYAHLCKLRDEVIEMGVLPPLGDWSKVNSNIS